MLLTKLTAMDNVKLDFLHIEEQSSTNQDIFSNKKYKPTLNNHSRFLATFDDANTIAEGIADIALGYIFSVYKEIKGTNQLRYVAHIDEGVLSVLDCNVVNDTTYKYYIFKEDDEVISEAVASNDITTCWWDWSLVNLSVDKNDESLYYADVDNVWKFGLNLSSSETTRNMSVTTYDNLTKYPKISSSKMNYGSGSITCLLGKVQKTNDSLGEYVEPVSMLEEWNDFCADGKIKLLKDRKGNAMLVAITGASANVDDILTEQPNTITFNWVQVGDVADITIIQKINEL